MNYSSHIYELTNWNKRRQDVLAPFAGKFFRTPVSVNLLTCALGQINGIEAEILQFFSATSNATRTFAIVSQQAEIPLEESDARGALGQFVGGTRKDPVGRVLWLRGDLAQNREGVSGFLRGSNSLTEGDFKTHGNLRFVADAKGIAVVDTAPNQPPPTDRAIRLSQVLALASAYQSILDDVIDRLANVGTKAPNMAEHELRAWSEFMSASYYSEPVKLATIELARFYGEVRERQKIGLLAQEVTEQLRLLAELVRLDRTERQQRREQGTQRTIALFGIILTMIGLAQITQVTPQSVTNFRDAWTECIQVSGTRACVLGEKIEAKDMPTNVKSFLDKTSKASRSTSKHP
jgi:hypothetical protein